jgi:hypothetical protein
MFRDLYRSAPHHAKPMTRPLLIAAALLALVAPAQARDSRKQLGLPASFAGLFCKDLQASNEVYEFFERAGHECGPGKAARYLIVSPRGSISTRRIAISSGPRIGRAGAAIATRSMCAAGRMAELTRMCWR